MTRGLLIALEGIDRAGKTTLSYWLLGMIMRKGHKVIRYKFPKLHKTQKVSAKIPAKLCEYYTSERKKYQDNIKQLLKDGYTVIIDRWVHSGIAYALARDCIPREEGVLLPDMVIYLDILPQEAALRAEYGKIPEENIAFQSLVYQKYVNLIDEDWVIMNARDPTHDIMHNVEMVIYSQYPNYKTKRDFKYYTDRVRIENV